MTGRFEDGDEDLAEREVSAALTVGEGDIDAEVLHGQVEHLLGRAGDAVDLVDEEHVALDEIGQHRGQIARTLQRRARRDAQRGPQLGGDDHRQ